MLEIIAEDDRTGGEFDIAVHETAGSDGIGNFNLFHSAETEPQIKSHHPIYQEIIH